MSRLILTLLFIFPLWLAGRSWEIKFSPELSAADAQKISLDGEISGSKKIELKDGTRFVLSKLSGKIARKSKLRAIAYTVIESDQDEERFIGIGADWFFTCFINGKKVLSTEPGGNVYTRVSAYNHFAKIKLQKGKNHLSLYIRPHLYQWKFAFALLPKLDMLPAHSGDRSRLLAALFPPENPGLLRKELVHELSCNKAAITCQFGTPKICGIRYRKSSDSPGQAKIHWNTVSGKRVLRTIHRMKLAGLEPDTEYLYEVVTIDLNRAKIVPASSGKFKTFPDKGVEHDFIIIGDTQVAPDVRQNAVKNMLTLPGGKTADFIVSLGDVANIFDNFEAHYFDFFFDILHRNKCNKPVVIVKGNHEYRGNDAESFDRHFGRSYYSFRHGEVFYIVLDTGEGGENIWKPGSHLLWTDTSELFKEQERWLEKVTSSDEFKNARYRIILAHASPFKYHAKFYAGSIRKLTEKFFFGAAPAHRIDLWLCGHVHYASRFDPATKKLYGFPFKKREKLQVDADDLADINFPVITNDGPGQGGEQLSVTTVKISDSGINVLISTPEGKVIDDVFIEKGKPHTVKSTVLQQL